MYNIEKQGAFFYQFIVGLSKSCLLIYFLLVALSPFAIADDLRSNINSWQRAYDVVSEDQVYVARTQNIFKRLKKVVGKSVLLSELYILDSDNHPWAIALEDGNVVLSRGALDIVYGASGTSLEAKDARMAFVLGHELKHIAKQDFWHEQVYRGFVSKNVESESDSSIVSNARRRESELRADEDGFIFASLAGFNTHELFTSIDGETDFLHYWVRQTNSLSADRNFSATQRVKFLAETMMSLDEAVKYFQFGTRLAYFGDHDNAIVLLNEFYKIFPSRQVLNNLGFVYLQLARRDMPIQLAHRFWFPLSLDFQSGSPNLHRSLELRLPATSRKYLEYAVQLLEEIDDFQADDYASLKNLAVAYIYLGDYSGALSVLEKAIRLNFDDYQLRLLMAIARVESAISGGNLEGAFDINQLVAEASKADAPIDLLFNTARLMELTGNTVEANEYWSRLNSMSDTLPGLYQNILCSHPTYFEKRCNSGSERYSVMPIAWIPDNTTGIKVGSSLSDKAVRKSLKSWGEPIVENLSHIDAAIYQNDTGNSLLVIDGIIRLVNQKQHTFDFKQHLVQVNAQEGMVPLVESQLGAENLLSNGLRWAAKVRGEFVEEIWFADSQQ